MNNMNEAKHTPGPWNLHPAYDAKPLVVESETGETWVSWSWYIAQGEKIIGDIQAYSDGGKGFPRVDNREEMVANATLCAAAPELLDALIQAENRLSKCIPENHGIHPNPEFEIVEQARTAIRKAKGEA